MQLKFTRAEKVYAAVLCGMQLNHADKAMDYCTYLNKSELEFIQEDLSPNRSREFITGRIISKIALQQMLPHYGFQDWKLSRGVFTQPVVAGPGALGISIAHTDRSVAALAFPLEHSIGIDLEVILAASDPTIIFEHCTQLEKEQALRCLGNETLASLKLWTCKESLSKILGTGLMTPFHFFELKNFSCMAPIYKSKFVHFPQYQSHFWLGAHQCLSMTFPANSVFQCSDSAWSDWQSFFL